jgi:hypothetical protein
MHPGRADYAVEVVREPDNGCAGQNCRFWGSFQSRAFAEFVEIHS